MIIFLRQIIFSVTAAALFGSVLLTLTEGKAQREIIRLAVGLMLVLALFQPLRAIQLPRLSDWFRIEVPQETGADSYQQTVLRTFEQQTAEYLVHQAEGMNIQCDIQVHSRCEDQEVAITSVSVRTGTLREEQRQALLNMVAKQCGIGVGDIEIAQVEHGSMEEDVEKVRRKVSAVSCSDSGWNSADAVLTSQSGIAYRRTEYFADRF